MWVYILQSEKTGRYYTGQCADMVDRLERHNSGRSKSTKGGMPWKLIWSIELKDRSDAMVLEQQIKKRGAKRFLESAT